MSTDQGATEGFFARVVGPEHLETTEGASVGESRVRLYGLKDKLKETRFAFGGTDTRHAPRYARHMPRLTVARRARVAEYTLRRTRAGPHTQDDLLYPPTAPVAI